MSDETDDKILNYVWRQQIVLERADMELERAKESPLDRLAEHVIGATAVLVGVIGQLESTAQKVIDSRANVAGQLPAMLTVKEAAVVFGISETALRQRIERGTVGRAHGYTRERGRPMEFHRETLLTKLERESKR